MIRRNTSNAHNYVEQLEESQFVGSRGIDVTKPCTSADSVIDMCNLDVDSDGGLSIRKPLICERKFSVYEGRTPDKFFMAFDGLTELEMYKENNWWVLWIGTIPGFYLKYTKYTGEVVDYSPLGNWDQKQITDRIYGDFKYATIVNTPNSTIITNVKIDYTHYDLVDPVLRPVSENEDKMVYRYLRLTPTDDGDVWQVEIINPEINMFNSAESAVLNPNLTLDSAYTLRDNYNAVSVGVTNILAYAIATGKTPPRLDIAKTFDGYTIKELTEKTIGLRPQILDTLKKDSKDFPVCLKAFVDVQPSDKSSYVCLWEKTFDGVNWEEVPEFIDENCILFDLPDNTVSNESLTTSGTYKTSKKCKIFTPKSSNDLITDRPDCLILDNFDNATYRFSIYSAQLYQSLLYSNISVKLDNSTDYQNLYNSTDYYRSDVPVKSHKVETVRTFELCYKLISNPTDLDFSKFEVKVFTNSETYDATITTTFNTSTHELTIQGSFTQGIVDNFFEMKPSLISVYYEGKILNNVKVMFCRYVEYTISASDLYASNMDKPYLFNRYTDYISAAGSETDLQALPNPVNVLEFMSSVLPNSDNTPIAVSGFFMDILQEEGQHYQKRNVYITLRVSSLKTIYSSWFVDGVFPDTNETSLRISLENNFLFLKNSTGDYVVLTFDDTFKPGTGKTKTLTMSDYELLAQTKLNLKIPNIENIVEVNKNRPFEKSLTSVKLNLGSKTYTFTFADSVEFIYNDIHNTVLGDKFYYKHAIYSYGYYFGTNIYPTDVNSFITPLFNVIDLVSTGSGSVTTLTPWRDYLVAATTDSIHLITKADGGYYTKLVNSFIGVPREDRRTCKAILNGIIFKSGCKVYALTPNANSGDDTILNITDLSKPIDGLIPTETYSGIDNFAFTTENAYYLFIPQKDNTVCFKYEYARKIWTKFIYPVVLLDYCIRSVEDILLFSKDRMFVFNKDITDIYTNAAENLRYGDILEPIEHPNDVITYIENVQVTPIPYYVNSGQKTDRMSVTKQFKESKIVLATISPKFVFPFAIDISVDGTLYNIHKDANTDGSLWKTSETSVGATGMTLTTSTSNIFNIIRQMYIRYSGRGKTIQHIISGDSYFNFKIYMVNYRYRILNVKQ